MSKDLYLRVAGENARLFDSGYNTIKGKYIDVKGSIDFANNDYYSSARLADAVAAPMGDFKTICDFEVVNKSAVDVIVKATENVCVLNFASQRNPGGGYLKGSSAQEEALCRASTLYKYLENCTEYYMEGRKSKPGIYSGNAIYSKWVMFFRDGNQCLLDKPVYADVVTCAAVNRTAVKEVKAEKDLNAIMYSRMKDILWLMYSRRCSHIILGAYGCGVFGNSPEWVADAWHRLLFRDGYADMFRKVTFAVLDTTPEKRTFKAFDILFK